VLGERLGLFENEKQKTYINKMAVRQKLTELSEIRDFRSLLPLKLQLHTRVPSYFEPSTGRLMFHDLLCVPPEREDDLKDLKK
jgi:hypothetical protein